MRPVDGGWEPDKIDLHLLRLLAEGRPVSVIARDLHLSERTIRRRLRSAAEAWDANTVVATVVQAVRRGLI